MIIISHRGNINGPNNGLENKPSYIDDAINIGLDVEIDLWVIDNQLFTGHDNPQYEISIDWLIVRKDRLWIHCKNINAIIFLSSTNLHYFWHENDTLTLTSKKILWVFPGNQPIENSIAVMPEINNDNVSKCLGVCTDYVKKYQ